LEDKIKMVVREVEWRGMEWIELLAGLEQVADCCECGNEPSGSIQFGEILELRNS
jgi:hypothetical protein